MDDGLPQATDLLFEAWRVNTFVESYNHSQRHSGAFAASHRGSVGGAPDLGDEDFRAAGQVDEFRRGCRVLLADLEAKHGCARNVSDMDNDLGVPNCERCLVPMVIEGTDDGPYWCCPECRIVRLA